MLFRKLKCRCKDYVVRNMHFHVECRKCRKGTKKNVKDLGMRLI